MSFVDGRIKDTTGTGDGVSIYDVQRALGTSKQDLGELCTHPNIKKWATFKPLPNGGPDGYSHDNSAPFGIRTIWRYVNPNDGSVSPNNNTTLKSAALALNAAILNQSNNPFINDMAMYVPPSGGASRAYRITDFVTAESVMNPSVVNRTTKNGYYSGATLNFGYIDQNGTYRGLIGRSLSVNSEGKISGTGYINIDQSKSEIWGDGSFASLDTRLTWSNNRNDEDSMCILDWLYLKWGINYNTTLHRGIVLFGDSWTERPGFVAVGTIPWGGAIGQQILGDTTASWNCFEFLTTSSEVTTSDFMELDSWNDNNTWYIIPGLFSKNLHVEGNNPYAIGANFQFADTNQSSPYGFNLFIQIRNLGANTSLQIFLSTSPNPGEKKDFLLNRAWSFNVTSTGSYNIYANETTNICPSGVINPSYTPFNQVFTVGQVYYVCIWGRKNATDSSQQVIWSQAVIATVDDMLQVANV